MGSNEKNGVSPGSLPGQGCKAANRLVTLKREGWEVVLPIPGGSTEGGGRREDQDIDPLEAEYGRAIYCDANDYGPVLGDRETAGDTGPKEMVGTDGD